MLRNIAFGMGTFIVAILGTTYLNVNAQTERELTPRQRENLREAKERYEARMRKEGSWKWLGASTCTEVNQGELSPKAGVGRMIFVAMIHPPTEEEKATLTQSIRATCSIDSYSAMYSILKKLSPDDSSSEDSSLDRI